MDIQVQDFATRPLSIRRAVAAHQGWIEETLGLPLAQTVIIDGLPNLSQVGIDKVLQIRDHKFAWHREAIRLRPLVAAAHLPPDHPPVLCLADDIRADVCVDGMLGDRATTWNGFEWRDCPLALRLHVYDCTVVVLNVQHHCGPTSSFESAIRLLVARRDEIPKLVRLFEDLSQRDRSLYLHTIGGRSRRVPRVEWNDLVVDLNVTTLLKNDFESFWQREEWFRDRGFPFRRGYLLHGPPGNGKTSAIRAMMSSRNLNAYTLRFFDPDIEDGDLDHLFDKAQRHRPAIILLEDIDRAFPKGESRCKISLQYLLNCLDGVATGEGVVVVATANEPAALDPAILRRPGRFDRVVHFANPDEALRTEYFSRMNSGLADYQLRRCVEASSGLSFAMLREAYVVGGQFAFERGGEMTEDDLLNGIRSLRQGVITGTRHGTSAGFAAEQVSR